MGLRWRHLISRAGTLAKPFTDVPVPLPGAGVRLTSHLIRPSQTAQFASRASSEFIGSSYDDDQRGRSSESANEYERRSFGAEPASGESDFLFRQLSKIDRGGSSYGARTNTGSGSGSLEGFEGNFSSLFDLHDGKLKKAATYFEFDAEEVVQDDYSFRPDVNFRQGTTYNTKDLDLTKLRANKFNRRQGFEVTTKDVLSKADFRNVKFLANFITEAGIIIKRSQTGISAKAQRKVAREIKTARAFGLLPFETMGTKSFQFGKTMEDLDADYMYDMYDIRFVAGDDKEIF